MNYQFKINDFEGPLDLLLHLVKVNKMDIYELNTSLIVDQYLKIIHDMEELNIDIASEYLVMASELVHLKSKLLINEDEPEEDFDITSEEDLKTKLIEYQKYKDLTTDFRNLELKRSEVYTKLPENLRVFKENDIDIKNTMDIDNLLKAFMDFLDRQEKQKPLSTRVTKKEYSVEERISKLRKLFRTSKSFKFIDLFDIMTKDYIIVTFLSILEMTKNKEVIIKQSRNFSDIYIEASEK